MDQLAQASARAGAAAGISVTAGAVMALAVGSAVLGVGEWRTTAWPEQEGSALVADAPPRPSAPASGRVEAAVAARPIRLGVGEVTASSSAAARERTVRARAATAVSRRRVTVRRASGRARTPETPVRSVISFPPPRSRPVAPVAVTAPSTSAPSAPAPAPPAPPEPVAPAPAPAATVKQHAPADKADKPQKPEKAEKAEKADKPEKAEEPTAAPAPVVDARDGGSTPEPELEPSSMPPGRAKGHGKDNGKDNGNANKHGTGKPGKGKGRS